MDLSKVDPDVLVVLEDSGDKEHEWFDNRVQGGPGCPLCNSEDLGYFPLTAEDYYILNQHIYCKNCKFEWHVIYNPVGCTFSTDKALGEGLNNTVVLRAFKEAVTQSSTGNEDDK
jgi:transposase-like protein